MWQAMPISCYPGQLRRRISQGWIYRFSAQVLLFIHRRIFWKGGNPEKRKFTVLARDFALTSYHDKDISPNKSYEYRISCQWQPNGYGTPSYYAGIHEGFNAYNTRQYTTISVSLNPVDFTGSLRDWKTLAAISGASITLAKPDGSMFFPGIGRKECLCSDKRQ